jgi:hypothetical protein
MNDSLPDTSEPTWMDYMRRGDFARAWDISDQYLSSKPWRRNLELPLHLRSVWNGESLHGKRVLVHCYHGLGDTIQFIRYTRKLKEIGCEISVAAQKSLLPLLKTVEGIDELHELGGSHGFAFEVEIELMELPHMFRSTLETIPNQVPYLHVCARATKTSGPPAVGVVWHAGDWNERRSIPFSLIKQLVAMTGVAWKILQRDPKSAGWTEGFGTLAGGVDPLSDALVMSSLGLMISVDSMPAHLAGALGVPTWTLLPFNADWRWMENRMDSPWYPTMRLFRQRQAGNWQEVIDEVSSELKQFSVVTHDKLQSTGPSSPQI